MIFPPVSNCVFLLPVWFSWLADESDISFRSTVAADIEIRTGLASLQPFARENLILILTRINHAQLVCLVLRSRLAAPHLTKSVDDWLTLRVRGMTFSKSVSRTCHMGTRLGG